MAGGGAGSPKAGARQSTRGKSTSPTGSGSPAAEYRDMQKHTAELSKVPGPGMHAYGIPRAVCADVCAWFGRHTQES